MAPRPEKKNEANVEEPILALSCDKKNNNQKTTKKKEFRFYRSLWKNCNQIRHTLLLYGVHFVTSL